jgi:hypothetical protein
VSEGEHKTRRVRRAWLAVSCVVGALLFLDDGTSSVLLPRDARRGRSMGCYTAIELLVGVHQPSWIRLAELVAGLGLLAYPRAWENTEQREQLDAVLAGPSRRDE